MYGSVWSCREKRNNRECPNLGRIGTIGTIKYICKVGKLLYANIKLALFPLCSFPFSGYYSMCQSTTLVHTKTTLNCKHKVNSHKEARGVDLRTRMLVFQTTCINSMHIFPFLLRKVKLSIILCSLYWKTKLFSNFDTQNLIDLLQYFKEYNKINQIPQRNFTKIPNDI